MSRDNLRFGDKLRPIKEVDECDLELRGGERWFVAQTLHHREKLAALHLAAQGFRRFLPRFRKTVRHARQFREVVAPVFPGYIFFILDPERNRWRSINGTFGVTRLVSAHGRPVPVPSGTVEAMVAAIDQSGLVRLSGELRPGQAVRVVAGPFAGGLGMLERLDGKGRVRVLLQTMGGEAPFTMDRAALSAV
ncbi:MAG: KOW motif-containing protein [Hyphomicrobiales bacterium]|nr:KOW motif-containing protein [Hyphomicrobiales bacterium]